MKAERYIPKILHLTVKDKRAASTLVNGIKTMQPDWEIKLYDDEDITAVMQLHFAELLEPFFLFPKTIQRLDVFRMLVVYLHGGFYMDTDVDLYKPLDDLRNNNLVFAEEKTLTPQEMELPHHQYKLRIANYMFGAIPGHPFLMDVAIEALSNCLKTVHCENDILETTGPGLLTNCYHRYSNNYSKITLLNNPNLICVRGCSAQPACHFGHYAAHLHKGSWRWQ